MKAAPAPPIANSCAELSALSISSEVRQCLVGNDGEGRVLASFARVCNVRWQSAQGATVIALVSPAIGNGPLNVVVADTFDWRACMPRTRVKLADNRLAFDTAVVDLSVAVSWRPRPDWQHLRVSPGLLLQRLQAVRKIAERYRVNDSLLVLLPADCTGYPPTPACSGSEFLDAARRGMLLLRQGLNDPGCWRRAAEQLAGLGPGLTPAGDDFLCGAMLALWYCSANPESLCAALAAAAASNTTLLAGALLRSAAAGSCSAAWHALLHAVTQNQIVAMEKAVGAVLACGHSSGGDTLAGFLWLCVALL